MMCACIDSAVSRALNLSIRTLGIQLVDGHDYHNVKKIAPLIGSVQIHGIIVSHLMKIVDCG